MMMIECREILAAVPDGERGCIESFDCFEKIGSTSSWLTSDVIPGDGCCRVAIADEQMAGRGRRDKPWASPKGAGLWLSLAWTFEKLPERLPGLTLAIGVALAEALHELGADVRLKWPNDLIANDGKLGGILTEMQTQADRQRTVIVGVGINVDLPQTSVERIEAERAGRVTDLKACLDPLPERTALAATVIGALIRSIRRFAADGLSEADLETWQRYDWLAGKRVTVRQEGRTGVSGTAWGVDTDGALLIRTSGQVRRALSGTVELQDSAEAHA
jgi:BirA family biotin operon repressor/biotin-[acetyl-CoA-carboxylase] ligase